MLGHFLQHNTLSRQEGDTSVQHDLALPHCHRAPVMNHNQFKKQYSFMHSPVCLTTGLQPLPKRVLHRAPAGASSCNLQYPLVSLTSSSNRLRLLHRLRITSILPSIFPSTPCLRRVLLRKMWPMQLAVPFLLYVLYQHGTNN